MQKNKLALVNGRIQGPSGALSITNILLVNRRILGLGYIPEDEETTTVVDLDGQQVIGLNIQGLRVTTTWEELVEIMVQDPGQVVDPMKVLPLLGTPSFICMTLKTESDQTGLAQLRNAQTPDERRQVIDRHCKAYCLNGEFVSR